MKTVTKAPKIKNDQSISSVHLEQYYVVKPPEEPFTVNELIDTDGSATRALQDMYTEITCNPLQEVIRKKKHLALRPFEES